MKKLKFLYPLSLLLVALFVISCTKDSTPPPLVSVSGTAKYTNAAGTSINAPGAILTLTNPTTSVASTATSDKNGAYSFINVSAGTYKLKGSWFTDNKNFTARMDGLTFTTFAEVDVTVASANLTQDVALTSAGQTGIVAMSVNYAWNPNATPAATFSNTGTWTFDNVHSPLLFEFPYRANEADFLGVFAQMNKIIITFDPNNLAGSSIDAEVDLGSVNTRTPGGRDNLLISMDNPTFGPTSLFTKLGCIAGTFGFSTDVALSSTVTSSLITSTKRYAQFKSTSIAKLGDGYVALGNLTFNGVTKPIEFWFKGVPTWLDASNNRTYAGFEGRFYMKPKADFGISSTSLNDAKFKIQSSIVIYK